MKKLRLKFHEGLSKEALVDLWREQVEAKELDLLLHGPLFMDVFEPDFDAWRFYEDGTESGSSPAAAQNTSLTARNPITDPKIHLRARVQEIGAGSGSGATTDDYGLEYDLNSSGTWVAITASSSAVQSDTASSLTADAASTNRATNGITDGTGTFVAGEQEETNGVIEDHQLTADNFTEHVWALTLVTAALADTDTLDFRITLNAGAPGMTNTVVPRITISKIALHDQVAFRGRNDDGTLITATNIAAENVDFSITSATVFRIRFQVNETAGVATPSTVCELKYSYNSAAYLDLNAASSVIQSTASGTVTNPSNVTNDYLTTSGGTFRTGRFDSDNSTESMFWSGDGAGNDHSECEFCLSIVDADVSAGDTIDIKMVYNVDGSDFDAYTQIPRVTVAASGSTFEEAGGGGDITLVSTSTTIPIFGTTVTNAVTLTETNSVLGIYETSVINAVTVTDTNIVVGTFNTAITNVITVVATTVSVVSKDEALTFDITPTETVSVIGIYEPTITGAIAAGYSTTVLGIFGHAITGAVTLTELTEGALAAFLESISDGITVTASSSVIGTFETVVTAAVIPTTVYVVDAIFETAVTNVTTLTATTAAIKTLEVSISDDITAAASNVADATFIPAITAAITLVATYAPTATFETSISPNITVGYTVIGTLVSAVAIEGSVIENVALGFNLTIVGTFETSIAPAIVSTATVEASGRFTSTWVEVDDSDTSTWTEVSTT